MFAVFIFVGDEGPDVEKGVNLVPQLNQPMFAQQFWVLLYPCRLCGLGILGLPPASWIFLSFGLYVVSFGHHFSTKLTKLHICLLLASDVAGLL